jgi:AAA domain
MFHLTVRVAWHDDRWRGVICNSPSRNSFCVALDRIREERDDAKEDAQAKRERGWDKLKQEQLPPCIAESGGFMNEHEWRRTFEHPYTKIPKAAATHGQLKPTTVKIPPYSTLVVPFAWMLRQNQEQIDESLPEPLPADEKSPFDTPWVFGRERQEALCELMFGRLALEHSLVFFYTKEGQPVGEGISRLVVGVGHILTVGSLMRYESAKKETYPFWDRIIRHSIRPEGENGFLLPYHDYLEPTGDAKEDERRLELLPKIAVEPDRAQTRAFSYGAELASADVVLSTLQRCLESVRLIRSHGIAKGAWEQREEWLNRQIASTWKERGAFPGLGSALEALGMRLGTALCLDLLGSGAFKTDDNPWLIVDAILRGKRKPPRPEYKADLEAVRKTWTSLSKERQGLLELLSRFDLTPIQAKRWFDPEIRATATLSKIPDREVLENPYRMSETDLGDENDLPVSVGVVDRGLLPDSTIAARHPVPKPSLVSSTGDRRRVRAALISVLRRAADEGDSLLSTAEASERLTSLDLSRECQAGSDWIKANQGFLGEVVNVQDVLVDAEKDKRIATLQLNELRQREERLSKVLAARAAKTLQPLSVDWPNLIKQAVERMGSKFDATNPRHVSALNEQAEALRRITSRKLTALIGRAGTGKTSALGALLLSPQLMKEGILLLAPTGKARVQLGKAANAEAMTIAQFLYRLDRYDSVRQRPLFAGTEKYRKEKTVVIDECSMLTMDDMLAVLEAMDLGHVQRVILVGDPNQLPPIGVGRPFADFVSSLEQAEQSFEGESKAIAGALGRLTIEVRATQNTRSDTLRLASWFTREPQPVDADRVLSDLELGSQFNDLEVCFLKTPASSFEPFYSMSLESSWDCKHQTMLLDSTEPLVSTTRAGFRSMPLREWRTSRYFRL